MASWTLLGEVVVRVDGHPPVRWTRRETRVATQPGEARPNPRGTDGLFQKADDLFVALGMKGQGSAYEQGYSPMIGGGKHRLPHNVLVEAKPPRIHTSV